MNKVMMPKNPAQSIRNADYRQRKGILRPAKIKNHRRGIAGGFGGLS
ncbi:hypothetical protein [Bradyrhizobium sp.]|nr:hypothetical protein [Bradyrhizobium sp.]MBV8918803.1 hypothetical protein [Bradyrhizobium sp.]MBV9984303.1 hypothetical protein [Bradyrhizobium sp.]